MKTINDYVRENAEVCSTIAMEECAELIQAISKAKRGKIDKDNMIEEMADVLVTMDWLKIIYDIDIEKIGKVAISKQNRSLERFKRGVFK